MNSPNSTPESSEKTARATRPSKFLMFVWLPFMVAYSERSHFTSQWDAVFAFLLPVAGFALGWLIVVRLGLKEVSGFRSWPWALVAVGIAYGVQAGVLSALDAAGVRELIKNVSTISALFLVICPLAVLVSGQKR